MVEDIDDQIRSRMKRFLLLLAVLPWLSLPARGQQHASFPLLTTAAAKKPAGYSVALTWNAATCQDSKSSTIACPTTPSYAVYRSATQGGGETCVNGLCYGYCCRIGYTESGVVTYTDTNVAAGQALYYVVTTVLPPCPAQITSTPPPCGESAVSNEVQVATPGKRSKKNK
jgi:hypothetical protein